jgi:hypothetical protein
MMPTWAFLVFVAIIVGAYFLGYSDGKMAEQENNLWERMDKAIASIPKAIGTK